MPGKLLSFSIAILLASPALAAPSTQNAPTQPAASQPAGPLKFVVSFDPDVQKTPYTGRVWIMTSTIQRREPRFGPDWFNAEPFASIEVKDWKPDTPLAIADNAVAFPVPISRWPAKRFRIQAVMDLAGDGRKHPGAPGNAYSPVVNKRIDPKSSGPIELRIRRIAPPTRLLQDDRIKSVEIESKLLSTFFGHPVKLRAALCLPVGYDPKGPLRYPAVYDIPGFGGDSRMILYYRARPPKSDQPFVYVVPDPNCPLGHHVFADSANNGPWSQALVEELIPYLEKEFRLVAEPRGRFLTGHSSGGWSSLWLMITHPDYFAGVWSSAPDPVDFRDFTGINLYAPGENAFKDREGKARPIARMNNVPTITVRDFMTMESAQGPGGQLSSFEAVFSPRGPDGQPLRLFDRKTGAINPEVAKTWQAYDINLYLRKNWKQLAPKLAGKLHIIVGDKDNFYLDGAVRLLEKTLKELGSDAEVIIVPDKDHMSLNFAPESQSRYQQMADQFRAATSQPARAP